MMVAIPLDSQKETERMGHPKMRANAGPSTSLRSAQDDRLFVDAAA
jgi:hypothetical protein